MPKISDAARLYQGTQLAERVYAGTTQVWPAAFDPLSIPWADCYWAGGPAFAALGLADGASIPSWPTETASGQHLAVNAGTAPKYEAAAPTFGNRPVVSTVAAVAYLFKGAAPTLNAPYTLVCVVHRTGGNSSPAYFGAKDGAAANSGLTHAGLSAGATLVHTQTAVPHLLEGFVNGLASEVYINGTLNASGSSGSPNPPNFQRAMFARANVPTGPLTGRIAFAGYLARGLTVTERANLRAWVLSHYGI